MRHCTRVSAALMAALIVLPWPAAADVIEVPLVNPGGGTGDLSGWNNPENRFAAMHDPPQAHGGQWLMHTSYLFDGIFGADDTLMQAADVSPYLGKIVGVTAELYSTQETGRAFDPVEQIEYTYQAASYIRFLGAGGEYFGDASLGQTRLPVWSRRRVNFTIDGRPYLDRVTELQLWVQGIWTRSDGSGGYEVPPEWITDVPEWTRYDDFALTLDVIPEPSPLIGLLAATLLLPRRRS